MGGGQPCAKDLGEAHEAVGLAARRRAPTIESRPCKRVEDAPSSAKHVARKGVSEDTERRLRQDVEVTSTTGALQGAPISADDGLSSSIANRAEEEVSCSSRASTVAEYPSLAAGDPHPCGMDAGTGGRAEGESARRAAAGLPMSLSASVDTASTGDDVIGTPSSLPGKLGGHEHVGPVVLVIQPTAEPSTASGLPSHRPEPWPSSAPTSLVDAAPSCQARHGLDWHHGCQQSLRQTSTVDDRHVTSHDMVCTAREAAGGE